MKLSKGVLGLKFMRKTRDEAEKVEQEKRHRQVFKSDVGVETDAPSSKSKCKVTECPSYLQCERYTYARQSYGGMNPTVEESIKKGTWFIEYETGDPEPSARQEVVTKTEVSFEEGGDLLQPKVDPLSSGEESDGPVMGSIIGTIGKRFNRKAMKRAHDPQDNLDEATISSKKRKKQLWKRNQSN
ncbi:unnamed protein product [Allacma fusca]|uniref:M-phase phosphoprotein 6 n=1 Tax=Allacma fusca TaxID=39272 RepID=A0A8J2P706_9HEXA|nr:unnamed protein product [Allacma fusca]